MNFTSNSFRPSLRKPRTTCVLLFVIFGLTATSAITAHAQLINIGIDPAAANSGNPTPDMVGSAVLGSTPANTTDVWNELNLRDTHSFTNLLSATGTTDVGLTATGFQGVNSSGSSTGGLAPALFYNFGYEFEGDGGVSTLDFSNLTPSTTYNLVFYTLNGGDHADTTYTINGVTNTLIEAGNANYTSDLTVNLTDPGTVYSGNYIQLTGMTDTLGNLDIAIGLAPSNTSNNGPQAYSYMAFTGLQLEQAAVVPEPTTTFLMAAGLGGLIAFYGFRRRGLNPRI